MKKCSQCGLVSDDSVFECESCGGTVFAWSPRSIPEDPGGKPVRTELPVERRNGMVILRCRTPDEALLVQEQLEQADIIAVLPNEAEMERQFAQQDFIEVQIPAEAYDSSEEVRSIVGFSSCAPVLDPAVVGYTTTQKCLAALLGFFFVPGLLLFAWILTGYKESGENQKAKDLKWSVFFGFSLWIFFLLLTALL